MFKRLLLTTALVALFSAGWAAESSAQVRARARVPARSVVVRPYSVSPFLYPSPWFYDPWFYDPWFYDYQWGYPPYGPYGRYNLAPESSVRLEVKPKQTEVFVDGYYAGIVDDFDGTFQRLHLPPGEHEIELYLEGYRASHQKVYLQPNNTFKIKLEMERLAPGEQPEPRPQPTTPPPQAAGPERQPPPNYPPGPRGAPSGRGAPQPPSAPRGTPSAYGTLAIRVQPADADVLVDGEKWRGPEGEERLLIQVPEGRHTIEIQKSGYRSYVIDVDVRRGETTPLNVSLRQQN